MALFFNRETEAERVFSQMESSYNSIAKIASQAKNKPTVFSGFDSRGTWYIPGGDSYAAKFIADAGGDYIWKNDRTTGSINLSFEQVFVGVASIDNFRSIIYPNHPNFLD